MKFRRNQEPFLQHLGTAEPKNVFACVCMQLALALTGIFVFGFTSASAFTMSIPLVFELPIVLISTLVSLVATWVQFPHRLPVHFVNVGPFTLRTMPFRFKVDWSSRTFGTLGTLVPRWPAHERDFERMEKQLRAFIIISWVLTAFLFLIAMYVVVVPSPWQLAPVAFVLAYLSMLVPLTFQSAKRLIDKEAETDNDLGNALTLLIPRIQGDQLHTVADDEIRTLLRDTTNSHLGMRSAFIAYLAFGSKGNTLEAARCIKRAVSFADQYRRSTVTTPPDLVNAVYLEAAYCAAAYAGDVDYAIRAIATSGSFQLDKTGYHLALTAIWIRQANRIDAQASFEHARKCHEFWREPGGVSHHEYQLKELEQVFETADLLSLNKPGIGPDFFADNERPIYGHAPEGSRFVTRCFQFCVLIPVIMLNVGARAVENSGDGTDDFGLQFALPVLVISIIWYFLQPKSPAYAEYTSEGICFRRGCAATWVPWAYIKSLTWDRSGYRIRSIELDHERGKLESGQTRYPKSIRLDRYRLTWPNASPEEALSIKAPHLFAAPDFTEDSSLAA